MPDGDFGRVAIGVRNGGPVPPAFFECWTKLLVSGTREGDVVLTPVVRRPAHFAANLLVAAFLKTDCDTLCFVDNDHAFDAATLEQLRSRPESWQYDGVGALYLARGLGKAIILTETPESRERPEGVAGVYGWPESWPVGDVVEVDGLGLGFTLIRRRVFEKLPSPWFYYPRESDSASEDLTLCRDARRAGFRLAVDTAVPIGHLMDNMAQGMPAEYMERLKELAASGAAPVAG